MNQVIFQYVVSQIPAIMCGVLVGEEYTMPAGLAVSLVLIALNNIQIHASSK